MLRDHVKLGVVVGLSVLLLTGCGSSSLTAPSPGDRSASRPTATKSSTAGVAGAVTKLQLISQDSCQTRPADQVYTLCDRYLAELRSAVGTIQNGAEGLPNAQAVRTTAGQVLDGAGAFERDGCGVGPYSAGPQAAPTCAADLTRIREGVSTLVQLTSG